MSTTESGSGMQKRAIFFRNIDAIIPVTTRERKEIILNEETYLIYHGDGYILKFKNLGGGIWDMYAEKKFK